MDTRFQPSRWSLVDLLPEPDGPSLQSWLRQLEEHVAALETSRPLLTNAISTDNFLTALRAFEAISQVSARLSAYADLWFSEDIRNPAALTLQGRLDQVLTDAGNRTFFFALWFKDLPDDIARLLIEASGDLHYFIESIRRFKLHMLNEKEEQIINLKDSNGIDALVKIYEMLTDSFSFQLEVDGETKTLTRDELTAYYRHPSPQVRLATYKELYRVFEPQTAVLSEIYTHRVRDWHAEQLDLRGYTGALSVRNLANDLPDAVVDALLSACKQNNGVFQRYFSLKAKWLGIDRLRRCDIYAPLAASDKRFPFDQAMQLILTSFSDFSPHMAELAERVIGHGHLDAESRPGKRSGAFCYTALPGLTPWVLVNYAGRARDVATLAHELGHAVHGMLAERNSILTLHPSLPLAETASVFAEMLLTERLLKEETDRAVRRDLLAYAIDDAWATVQRQAYFTLFESQAHQMIMQGHPLDSLLDAYMQNLAEQFGDSVELSDEFKWEWITISHIYTAPFYTYAYSFGQLLVLALYQQYRTQGTSFIPGYFKLLSTGGADSPVSMLKNAGIDIATPEFWQGGYDVLTGMIDELEGLS